MWTVITVDLLMYAVLREDLLRIASMTALLVHSTGILRTNGNFE